MSMGFAFGTATLVPNASGATVTGVWRSAYQIAAGASAEQVELDAAPLMYFAQRTSAPGGMAGEVSMTVTATGFTLTSTHVGETGTFRVFAWVRPMPQWWEV